jgi:hypothetical protein
MRRYRRILIYDGLAAKTQIDRLDASRFGLPTAEIVHKRLILPHKIVITKMHEYRSN